MKDTSIIQLFRMGCGTTILLISMLTGVDGQMILAALFLLGVPFEAVKYAKEKQDQEDKEGS